MINLKSWGPMTVLVMAVALIVVVVGAILVVTDNYDDDFTQWVNDLILLAGAGGLLGIGRGLRLQNKPVTKD